MRLYHFTAAGHLPTIQAAGFLKVTESNVHPTRGHVGPDVVWLTSDPLARLGHGLISNVDKAMVRFTVDLPAILWTDWAPAQDTPGWWRDTMVKVGGGAEAAATWYVWPAPIPAKRWLAVETRPATGWEVNV